MPYNFDDAMIQNLIDSLPKGTVNKKSIHGKDYYYHRWMENGKRIEKTVPADQVENLKKQIQTRKDLEKLLKANAYLPTNLSPWGMIQESNAHIFHTSVRTGDSLKNFIEVVKDYKTRDIFKYLEDYLYNDVYGRVFILYGLRRTGKTTMIMQAILNMDAKDLIRSAYIKLNNKTELADIDKDLNYLQRQGYKYIFIDEVTLMGDFISGASLFSDIYAMSQMKIILSGTDSLSFLFARSDQLFDRCILLHTTFIPYREFENILGIQGIDNYIRYGGTMSLSGKHYNDSFHQNTFNIDEYVDSAIAHNIQHSLKYYQYEGHFRSLEPLYLKNELTNAINRVVEDINHRFTLEVLTKDFKSNDLAITRNNLIKDKNYRNDIFDKFDSSSVTEKLMDFLEIKNKENLEAQITEDVAFEVEEYLQRIDLVKYVNRENYNKGHLEAKKIITQPALRYAQCCALLQTILKDDSFQSLTEEEKKFLLNRMETEVMGRMMEDIVLLETQLFSPNKNIFILQFDIGEFDMVIQDIDKFTIEIFEIKHSDKIVPEQYQHLIDKEKCNKAAYRYGKIIRKAVIYRGKTTKVNDIDYINVEEYLNGLGN